MKLLLRRDQRSSMLGKVVFSLEVRAELSDDERCHINKYRLGDTRVLRVARTIADLAGAEGVGRIHVAEALSYRRQAPRN